MYPYNYPFEANGLLVIHNIIIYTSNNFTDFRKKKKKWPIKYINRVWDIRNGNLWHLSQEDALGFKVLVKIKWLYIFLIYWLHSDSLFMQEFHKTQLLYFHIILPNIYSLCPKMTKTINTFRTYIDNLWHL
jgi:hypothetical protein